MDFDYGPMKRHTFLTYLIHSSNSSQTTMKRKRGRCQKAAVHIGLPDHPIPNTFRAILVSLLILHIFSLCLVCDMQPFLPSAETTIFFHLSISVLVWCGMCLSAVVCTIFLFVLHLQWFHFMAAYALFPLLLKFLDPCELKKSGSFFADSMLLKWFQTHVTNARDKEDKNEKEVKNRRHKLKV